MTQAPLSGIGIFHDARVVAGARSGDGVNGNESC
jgi:hypothetical protein